MEEKKVIKLLNDIGIKNIGEFKKDKYTIVLKNSDEYAKYYTLLDKYDDLNLIDASSMSQEFATSLCYTNDMFKIYLNANLTDDYYTFVVEEKK